MILNLYDIPQEGLTLEESEPASILELEDAFDIHILGSVEASLKVVLVGQELIARGRLAVEVEFLCSRCAEFFPEKIEESDFLCVRDVRLPEKPGRRKSGAAGKSSENMESVDLTPDIREAILLAFPLHWVCSPDCRGLCPQCGMNWNKGSCTCKPPEDNRWDALSGLELTKGTTHGRTKKKSIKE